VIKASKDEEAPPLGTVLEFTKEGTMKIIFNAGGKEATINGIYKVDGDAILYTLKLAPRTRRKTRSRSRRSPTRNWSWKGKRFESSASKLNDGRGFFAPLIPY
jgi:hypothetical protein